MPSMTHVIVSAVLAFVLGWLWYGPLFGAKWCAIMGKTEEDRKNCGGKKMMVPMAITFILWLITAFVFGWLLPFVPMTHAYPAFCLAIALWLGFKMPHAVGAVIWGCKPKDVLWLEGGFTFAAMLLIAAVFTYL